jgi:thiamine pyrophosphate-dependent acetolactate synthase large subunit-like protein
MWNDEDAIELAAQSDLLLVLEADEDTARFSQKVLAKNSSVKVIQSAELATAIASVIPVDVGLVGTVRTILSELTERLKSVGGKADRDDGWLRRLTEMKSKLEKEYLVGLGPGSRVDGVLKTVEIVSELIRPEDYVVCDGPLAAKAAILKLKHSGLHHTVPIADDYIPGAGLPVALGIKAAAPNSRVFFIAETSRMKRHSREFQTASRYKLPVTTFLFQDKDKKPDEEVNFSEMAKSLGVQAQTITEPVEEITKDAVTESFSKESGMLFDVSSF